MTKQNYDNSIVNMKLQRDKLLRIPEATYEALEEISNTSPVDDTDPVYAIGFLIRYFHITRRMWSQPPRHGKTIAQELLYGEEEQNTFKEDSDNV